MRTFITFAQNHKHIINATVFDKDCIGIVNGNLEEAKKIFRNEYSNHYSEVNFDIGGIEFYPRGFIEVPNEIYTRSFVDPLDKFHHMTDNEIYQTLGALPYWVINEQYMEIPLKEALDKQYGFGLYKSTGQTIEKDGTYKFPGDPNLYPLIKIERKDEIFYQYLYGMVVFVNKDGTTFVTRMD